MAAMDSTSFDPAAYGTSFGSIDLSTVDPNPTLDSGSSSGGTDWSSILNSVGQWGSTIASIATHTPVQTTGTGTIIGAKPPTLLGSTTNNQLILTVLIVAVIGLAILSLSRRKSE